MPAHIWIPSRGAFARYSPNCLLRDLTAKVLQKLFGILEIAGMSDNPPEFLTIRCQWRPGQRFRKNLHVREKRPEKNCFWRACSRSLIHPARLWREAQGLALAKFALLEALPIVVRSLRCRLAQFTKPKN
jgi:hypothetical protein